MKNQLHNHPAVEAWVKLESGNKIPKKVVTLHARKKKREKKKSAVFKLEGVVADDLTVVAKRCSYETARVERLIYERVLPKLPIITLRFFGYVENRGQHWLFIEYAGGASWSPCNAAHQKLAAKWLANFHYSSSLIEELSLLPESSSKKYLRKLNKVTLRSTDAASRSRLNIDELHILDEIYRSASLLESRWSEITSFCDSIPSCLAHNDFIDKNLQVRGDGADLTLLPFDWEMSVRSIPASDLHWMLAEAGPDAGPKAIKLYWMYRNRFSENLLLADIEHLARLGVIFRSLDALEWTSWSFGYDTAAERGKSLTKAKLYVERMTSIFGTLGWH